MNQTSNVNLSKRMCWNHKEDHVAVTGVTCHLSQALDGDKIVNGKFSKILPKITKYNVRTESREYYVDSVRTKQVCPP